MKKKSSIHAGSLVALFGVVIMTLVTVLFSTGFFPAPAKILSMLLPHAAAPVKTINVLELRYLPLDYSVQDAKTTAVSSLLVTDIVDASRAKGYKNTAATPAVQPVIKYVLKRASAPPYTQGNFEVWYDSLNTILTQDHDLPGGMNLCDYIVANNIDQVWGWFDVRAAGNGPIGGYNQEFTRFWSYNVLPVQQGYQPLCGGKRSFIFLGLDQNAGVDNALHSFGHSMESMLTLVQGHDLFWTKWAGITGAEGGTATTCGDVHFPPNGAADYDYVNTRNVTTSCEDWKPDGTGTQKRFTCAEWGCSQEGYMKWWLQNMPNANNGLTYAGRAIPNWWDLLGDTDNAIGQAAYRGEYLTSDFLDSARPSYLDSTSKATQASGASLTMTQTISGTNRLLMVAASYRSPAKAQTDGGSSGTGTKEQITGVKWGTTALTRVNRTITDEYTTELWYLVAPATGSNTITVSFVGNVQDQNLSGASFTGVNQTTPFANAAGSSLTGGSATPTITVPTTASQVLFGVTSMYTGSNTLTVSGATRGVFGLKTMNVIGKGAVAAGGATATLSWSGTSAWPWSISAVAINLTSAPAVTPTPSPSLVPTPSPTPTPVATPIPTPVPSPVPTPTPTSGLPTTPTVDLKINGQDRVYTQAGLRGSTIGNITLTWKTVGATSCKALGSWTGAKPVNGSATVAFVTGTEKPNTKYYALQCVGAGGATWYDVAFVVVPQINTLLPVMEAKMFVNGFDDTMMPAGSGIVGAGTQQKLYIKSGSAPVLSYISYGQTCTSPWIASNPKGAMTTGVTQPAITKTTTYSMTCDQIKKTVTYSVSANIR